MIDLIKKIELKDIKKPKYIEFLLEKKHRLVFAVVFFACFFFPSFFINLAGGNITLLYLIIQFSISVGWGLGWTRLITLRSEYKEWLKEDREV